MPLMRWTKRDRNFAIYDDKTEERKREARKLAKCHCQRKIVCVSFFHFVVKRKGTAKEFESLFKVKLGAQGTFTKAYSVCNKYYTGEKLRTLYSSDEKIISLSEGALASSEVTSALGR